MQPPNDINLPALTTSASDGRPRLKIVVGSGWWCDGTRSPWLIGDQITKTPEFFRLWLYLVRRYIEPDQIVIIDSRSPLKPSEYLRNDLTWIELDRNYGHSNDIRTGRVVTKFAGNTRAQILGAMFALCNDADIFCYVEQDCIIRGRNIIDQALAGRQPGIVVGGPPINAIGLNGGRAAGFHQEAIVIVGRNSLQRFIVGRMRGPETDGELSSELKLVRDCAPIDILAIPYGRSRPIEFEQSHYYAQCLTEDELRQFLAVEGLRASDFNLRFEKR
jgi:hypothetical protein